MSQDETHPWEMTWAQQADLEEAIQHLKFLEPIAQSLSTLAEQGRPTTEPQPSSEPERLTPRSELPADANPEEMTLPDGRKVPTKVIRALAEYDETVWPGALDPMARASVASVVIGSIKEDEQPALRTNYPFCLDDPEGVSNDSPCIKRADHRGQHIDNNDGTW